ncbi:MAG: nucleoside-triphosphatase [Pirellulales bacterium]|nr:nucleoside-triphosphatase [Pirellulales bacterium]
MHKVNKNILISGLPGIGKTTLIKNLVREMPLARPKGFYTEEIRYEGERKGFQAVSLSGEKMILAHELLQSGYNVGKYKVDVKGFDKFLDGIDFYSELDRPVIIDEIGKMECLSNKFVKLVLELLDSPAPFVATIAHTDGGIKGRIKKREDVTLYKMNLDNRDALLGEVLSGFGHSVN